MSKTRNWTRIAFPEMQSSDVDRDGNIRYSVPASFFWDKVGRTYTVPAGAIKTIGEPPGLTYSHAVYCDSEICIKLGVMGIQNPRRRQTYRRVRK